MTEGLSSSTDAINAIATLSDGTRRRLYEVVRAARRPVSRDDAASAVGISRKLAAFHLDKLVDAGLLDFGFDGQAVRGRPPKVYLPTRCGVAVSVPPRRYELLAEILARAMEEGDHDSALAAATQAAYERGQALALQMPTAVKRGRMGAERALAAAERALEELGFEPYRNTPRCVRLSNCPFHELAATMPALVCQLNHALTSGVLAGLHAEAVEAVLAPTAGECCVELRARPSGA
ncbi:transcriptional regulator [Mycolicibacterium flavescens]|uniref:Transcriptional regulator n=1 Tax=Mycolicibacterium flavescens TaxID=1776 RepID=A0A1E3RLE4_MYCFV|nr:helix-turn-helix domain-containing protein [Mycolicibacterium flavescens]MCV7281925.1 transcriptional regulator [Mycolicibacterium flavescens]ODQ90703.1 transcriptional regulator [Mycolicibacterium flavescens]